MNTKRKIAFIALALTGMLTLPNASAQITNTVFSEDFSKALDPNKLVGIDHSLEGGQGNITNTVHDGVVEFTGEVTQQWWAGATLKVVPSFTANIETNVMVSVDRVSEAGVGSSSRSCLWITDSTRNFFVLFADNRGENHWQYNRKIGLGGDSPTGGGNAITAFDAADGPYLDEGSHRMKAIANGKTVKLYLDDVFGAEVAFPFDNLQFEIGAAARATGDTADAAFDNLLIQTVGAAAFSQTSLTLVSGQTVSNLTVRIPAGLNKTSAVTVRVVSSDPTIAIPVGATAGTLTLTFAAGASNEQTIAVKSTGGAGAVNLTLANDIGLAAANALGVVVIEGAGVRFSDDFSGATVDTTKWTNSDIGFETGLGTFTTTQTGGQLVIAGTLDNQAYWGGKSLTTVKTFTATPELPLVFEMDRVSVDPTSFDGSTPSTGARTGVFLETAGRTNYLFFGENKGETGWEVNVNATGSGTSVAAFASITNTGSHHIKMVSDGSNVKIYLDGIYGGSYAFAANLGIQFEVGVYARAIDDSVKGVFDNVQVANIYPTVSVSPTSISSTVNVNTNTVAITVPKLLVATKGMNVTVTSQNPNVAVPAGAVNGVLTLPFAAGGTNVQTFQVKAVSAGTTSFVFTNDQSLATDSGVDISILPSPKVVFTDNFTGPTVDSTKWVTDNTPLVSTGTLTDDSSIFITNGVLEILATCVDADWSGLALFTKATYTASALSPVDFEVDRTKMEYVLSGGSGTLERTGIWIKQSDSTNYVFFNFLDNHEAATVGGWQYNAVLGVPGDILLPASGTVIQAFTGTSYLDTGSHHMKVQVNGTTAKLYLDGVFGASAPCTFTNGITFGVGAYVNYANNSGSTVRGYFDNVAITQYPASAALGSLSAVKQANGDLMISWTGAGTLQSNSALPGTWSDVSPAPTGQSYTIPAASLTGQKYFRLRQ